MSTTKIPTQDTLRHIQRIQAITISWMSVEAAYRCGQCGWPTIFSPLVSESQSIPLISLVGTWEGGKKIKTVNALNLTPDASGISYFDETMFIEVIRNGGFRTRPLSNIMPWEFFRNLTDDDLKAIFAYLRTLKPVCHHVDNTEPPTYCKQCRTRHGLGATN